MDSRYIYEALVAALKSSDSGECHSYLASYQLLRASICIFEGMDWSSDGFDALELVEQYLVYHTTELTESAASALSDAILTRLNASAKNERVLSIDKAAFCLLGIRLHVYKKIDEFSGLFNRIFDIKDYDTRKALTAVLRSCDPNRLPSTLDDGSSLLKRFISYLEPHESDSRNFEHSKTLISVNKKSAEWVSRLGVNSELLEEVGSVPVPSLYENLVSQCRAPRNTETCLTSGHRFFAPYAASRITEHLSRDKHDPNDLVNIIGNDFADKSILDSTASVAKAVDALYTVLNLMANSSYIDSKNWFKLLGKYQTLQCLNALVNQSAFNVTEIKPFLDFCQAACYNEPFSAPPDTIFITLVPLDTALISCSFSSKSDTYQIYKTDSPFDITSDNAIQILNEAIDRVIEDSELDVILLGGSNMPMLFNVALVGGIPKSKRLVSMDLSWQFLQYRLRSCVFDASARKIASLRRAECVICSRDFLERGVALRNKMNISLVSAGYDNRLPEGDVHGLIKVRISFIYLQLSRSILQFCPTYLS